MLGARDVALGLGAVRAHPDQQQLWLRAAAFSDAMDLLSCLLARRRMTTGAAAGTIAFSAGVGLLDVLLSRRSSPAARSRS